MLAGGNPPRMPLSMLVREGAPCGGEGGDGAGGATSGAGVEAWLAKGEVAGAGAAVAWGEVTV